MELRYRCGIPGNDAAMTGQGNGMPGMAALGAKESSADTGAGTPEAPAGDVFDTWLRAELGRLYDTTLNEPVPPDMLRLLNSAAKR